MGIIKPLKNKEGKNIYPITRAEAIFVNDTTKLSDSINNIEKKRKDVVNKSLSNISELKAKNVTEEINTLVNKENNWKKELASEITKKGVVTDGDATYITMSQNIRDIPQEEYITENRRIQNVREIKADYTIKDSILDNVEITTEEEYGTETDDGKYKLTFSVENMDDNTNIAYKNSGAEIILPHKFNPGNKIFKNNDKYVLEEPSINKISYDHKYKKGGYPEASMIGTWDRYGELAKPTNFKCNASSVVYKDKLYIFGNDKIHNQIAGGIRLQIYDFIFNTWEEVNFGTDTVDEYVNIKNSMMVAYRNKLYIFGGINTTTATEKGYTNIYSYDIASKQFTTVYGLFLPAALTDCGYTMIGNKVYIFGGRIVGGGYNTTTYCIDFDTFKVYDVPCLSLGKLVTQLLFPAVTQIGDYLYVIDGSTSSSNNVFMFHIPSIGPETNDGQWISLKKSITNNGNPFTYCKFNESFLFVPNTSSSMYQLSLSEHNLSVFDNFKTNLPLSTINGILCCYNNELYYYTREYDSPPTKGTFCKLHQELEIPTWKPDSYADTNIKDLYNCPACAVGDACYIFESRTNAIRVTKFTPKNNRTEVLSDLIINHKITDLLAVYYNGIVYIQIGVELYRYNVDSHSLDSNVIILSTTNKEIYPYTSLKVFDGKLYCLGITELVIVDLSTYEITNINRNGAYNGETLVSNRDKMYLLNMSGGSNNNLTISEFDIKTNTFKLIKIINERFNNNFIVEYMGHVYSIGSGSSYRNYKVLSLEDFTIQNGADYPITNMATHSTVCSCVFGNKIYIFSILYTNTSGSTETTNIIRSITLPTPHRQMAILNEEAIYNPYNISFPYNESYFMHHYLGHKLNGTGSTGQRVIAFSIGQTTNNFFISNTILSGKNIITNDDFTVTSYMNNNPSYLAILICGGTIKNNSGVLLQNGIYLDDSPYFSKTTPIITGPYDFGFGTSIVVGNELFVIFPSKLKNFGTSNQINQTTKDINIYDLNTNSFKMTIEVSVNGYHQISKINSFYYKGIIYITLNDTQKAYLYKFNVDNHDISYRIIPMFDSVVAIQNYLLIDENTTKIKSGHIYMYDMEKDLLLSSSELPSYPLINSKGVVDKFTFEARDLIFNAGGRIKDKTTGNYYCDKVLITKIPMLNCNENNEFTPCNYSRYNAFPITKNNDVYFYSGTYHCIYKLDINNAIPYKIYNNSNYEIPSNFIFAGLLGSKYLFVYADGTIRRLGLDNGSGAIDNKGFIAPFTGVYNKPITYKNKLYIISPYKGSQYSRYAFSFSYETGYTELASITGKPRRAPSTCLVSNKIYCFGGLSENGELLDECMVYDIESNTWKLNSQRMPYKCHEVQTIRVGNIIYIFGGTLANDNINIIFYYIEEDRYEITDMPYIGSDGISISVLDKIYVLEKGIAHNTNSQQSPKDYCVRSIQTHGWHREDYTLPFFIWRTTPVKANNYIFYLRIIEGNNLRLLAFDVNSKKHNVVAQQQHSVLYQQYPPMCIDDSKENIYYIYNGDNTSSAKFTLIKYNISSNTETVIFNNINIGNLTSLEPIEVIHCHENKIYFMTNVGDNKMYYYDQDLGTFFVDTIPDTTGKIKHCSSLKIGTSLYYIYIGTEIGGSDYISDLVKYDLNNHTFEKITIKNMPKDFYLAFNYNIFNIGNKIYIHNYNFIGYNEDFLVIDIDTKEAYFSNLLPSVGGHYSKILYDDIEKMIYMLGGYNMTPNNVTNNYFDGTVKTLNYGEIKQYKTPKELIPIEDVTIHTKAHRTIIKPVNCPNINMSCDIKIDVTPDK